MSRPIALRAAKEALDNIGVQEVGDNRGKAIEVYQASTVPPVPPGSPWCAAFSHIFTGVFSGFVGFVLQG